MNMNQYILKQILKLRKARYLDVIKAKKRNIRKNFKGAEREARIEEVQDMYRKQIEDIEDEIADITNNYLMGADENDDGADGEENDNAREENDNADNAEEAEEEEENNNSSSEEEDDLPTDYQRSPLKKWKDRSKKYKMQEIICDKKEEKKVISH